MKKKVISALLCAAMAVSMLAGCGGSKSDSKKADKSATESTKAASDTFTFAIGGDTGNTLNPITADDRWGTYEHVIWFIHLRTIFTRMEQWTGFLQKAWMRQKMVKFIR